VGQTWTHLPQLVQLVDSPQGVPMSVTTALDPRAHQVPGMRSLDLVADAHAAYAHDAAVVVDRESGVTGVDVDLGVDVRQLEMVRCSSSARFCSSQ
jgi:hypothetical protein